MIKKLITGPALTPVGLSDIKAHLRVNHTDQDDYIDELLLSAIDQVENITGRAVMTQTWAVIFDSWSEMTAEKLPLGRLQSVTSIKYNDESGIERTVSSSDYLVSGIGTDEGKIIIPADSAFTYPDLFEKDPITVTFVCGHATESAVSSTIKTAIKLIVDGLYHDADVERAVDAHLMPHRIWSL